MIFIFILQYISSSNKVNIIFFYVHAHLLRAAMIFDRFTVMALTPRTISITTFKTLDVIRSGLSIRSHIGIVFGRQTSENGTSPENFFPCVHNICVSGENTSSMREERSSAH